jgi:hypothetical protein
LFSFDRPFEYLLQHGVFLYAVVHKGFEVWKQTRYK